MSDQIKDLNTIPFTMVHNFMLEHGGCFFDDPIEAYIYLYLKRRAGSDNNAFPSLKRIAIDCITSTTTVNRKINILVKKHLLIKVPQTREDGGKASNLYHIAPVKLANETRGDGSNWFMGMVQIEGGAWFKLNYKEDTSFKKKPYKVVKDDPQDLKEEEQKKKPKEKTLLADETDTHIPEPMRKANDIINRMSQKQYFRNLNIGQFASFIEHSLKSGVSIELIEHLVFEEVKGKANKVKYYETILDDWIAKGITEPSQLKKQFTKGKPFASVPANRNVNHADLFGEGGDD